MNTLYAHIGRLLAMTVASAALGGCMTSSPIWEAHFGEAVRTSMHAQIIDPDAAQHVDVSPGIDGKAAAASIKRYTESYEKPPTSDNAFTMGVTSGTSH
ncbi:tRNA delta(2)-isopentenylpyrophosphate transferase [Paraburkholderia tropica]|uniref:hypothetical protein n=1 Tax=Paraburkholderia TaxID=1822464 RepID=UPI001CB55889|nr:MULTISPECIES: hypothetical protein [Paraburkholderia]CAG9211908.1 tRNA delta(2)-isopentenylpyrophosphate transferase [Paraburkholderia tropica]